MSNEAATLIGFGVLFVLMAMRVPIGFAMVIVGFTGFGFLTSWDAALFKLGDDPFGATNEYILVVIPLFLLMGQFASRAGLSKELFDGVHRLVGHFRGGLAIAGIGAAASFAAICGSSVATAGTMAKVALPEMRRYGYADSLSTGSLAAGGTLGILIPPSIVLAIYGIIAEQNIGALFIAGVIPGVLAMVMYMLTISIITRLNPSLAPQHKKGEIDRPDEERTKLTGLLWVGGLFGLVIGGLYTGAFTPSEAAGIGSAAALGIAVIRRRIDFAGVVSCLKETARSSAAIFMIIIGAIVFQRFLAITRTPDQLLDFFNSLGWGPTPVIIIVLFAFLLLGCVMDATAIIVLAIPVVLPLVTKLGFDLVWFGVIAVMVTELALITPPVGLNVFVVKASAGDIRLSTIYRGVIPFVICDILRLAILVAFPIIVLYLPRSMF